jgi:hypothetical protein
MSLWQMMAASSQQQGGGGGGNNGAFHCERRWDVYSHKSLYNK